MKIGIGITGQAGFIGTHLYNFLNLDKENFNLIPFKDEFFDDEIIFNNFVSKCDCIVHLAALNRHNEEKIIFSKNIELVDKLIKALEKTKSKAHIIFSSSTQEERDNIYGRSKREGRLKLTEFAKRNNSGFTGLIIPNVFGPFGRPFYNSVISTFSHQLVNNTFPKIEIDAELKLIYVGELVKEIRDIIFSKSQSVRDIFPISHTYEIKVSEILKKLEYFRELYFNSAVIPNLVNNFEINLFNTFRSYIDYNTFFPYKCKMNIDERGNFSELIKLNIGGQISYSTTKPGITRGNHFHTRKIERFTVIKGKALIQLRKIGSSEIINLEINGETPSFVDMPVWFTHNIKNTGNDELITIFWINEFYDPKDSDTYFETV